MHLEIKDIAIAITGIIVPFVGMVGWLISIRAKSTRNEERTEKLFDFKDAHDEKIRHLELLYERDIARMDGRITGLSEKNNQEFKNVLESIGHLEKAMYDKFGYLESIIRQIQKEKDNR